MTLDTTTVTPTFHCRKSDLGNGPSKFTIEVRKGDKIVWTKETRNAQLIYAYKRDAANWAARKYHLTPEQIVWR